MANRIGNFEFVALHGSPLPPTEQPELVARAGVDGVGGWRTGVRGTPFRMLSQVDMPTYEIAGQVSINYTVLIGQDPVSLVQDDVEFPYQVVVLSVVERSRRGMVISTGGLYPPSAAWLESEWTLMAVDV